MKKMAKQSMALRPMILDNAQQIWLAGLGAFAMAGEEGKDLFAHLVKRGADVQKSGKARVEHLMKAAERRATGLRDDAEAALGRVRLPLDKGMTKAMHRLGIVAHTAYYLPFGTPFASIREACLSEFRRALRVAHQIGATVMNVHYSKAPGFFSKDQVIGWHVEVLGLLCDEAKAVGLTIVLEHVPFGGAEQLENIVAIMEKVPLLRFHLDSGHAKLERGYDRWDEYLEGPFPKRGDSVP